MSSRKSTRWSWRRHDRLETAANATQTIAPIAHAMPVSLEAARRVDPENVRARQYDGTGSRNRPRKPER